jgi:hypothetical protein
VKAKRKRGGYHTVPTLAKTIDLRVYRDEHLAIIEKVREGRALTINERGYVAEWLLETWLPAHEVSKIRRARRWEGIEMLIQTGMHFSKEEREPTRESVVARVAEALGSTPEALEQRLKEHRTVRKMRPVFATLARAPSKSAGRISRKRR